jgi:hypothetical protein
LWSATGAKEFEHNSLGGRSWFLPQNKKVTDRWKFENPIEARNARDIFSCQDGADRGGQSLRLGCRRRYPKKSIF